MRIDGDAGSFEQREPQVAKRGFLVFHDQMLTESDAGSFPCDERGAICQVVDALDVAAENHGGVIEQV